MSPTHMLWCAPCKDYTLHEACHRCGAPAKPNQPARYSPEDPYGEYRRKLKRMDRDAKKEA